MAAFCHLKSTRVNKLPFAKYMNPQRDKAGPLIVCFINQELQVH